MSQKIKNSLAKEMQNMEAASLLRTEVSAIERETMEAVIQGKKDVLNFYSSDFLAWQYNFDIKEAAQKALRDYGSGSTSSRATLGTLDILNQLEHKLCEFLNVEACIVLPSRYLANIGVFDALTNDRDSIFIDEGCDHGLVDGVRFAKAKAVVYNFKDYNNLEYQLKCSESARYRIIASDGIFNADASWANIETINGLKEMYDAITVIDDSLGIGLLGASGRGTCHHLGLPNPDILTGSFSQGLGNIGGGFIAGDATLIEWLRQSSRSYLLSEPLSPVNAAVAMKAIELLEQDQSPIEALSFNANYLKKELRDKDWDVVNNEHPLTSIIIGSTLVVQKMIETLFENGFLLSGLCYPNAPEGAARLRIHLSAKHSTQQIDSLISALERVKHFRDKE